MDHAHLRSSYSANYRGNKAAVFMRGPPLYSHLLSLVLAYTKMARDSSLLNEPQAALQDIWEIFRIIMLDISTQLELAGDTVVI